jgi:hypothetical protein
MAVLQQESAYLSSGEVFYRFQDGNNSNRPAIESITTWLVRLFLLCQQQHESVW